MNDDAKARPTLRAVREWNPAACGALRSELVQAARALQAGAVLSMRQQDLGSPDGETGISRSRRTSDADSAPQQTAGDGGSIATANRPAVIGRGVRSLRKMRGLAHRPTCAALKRPGSQARSYPGRPTMRPCSIYIRDLGMGAMRHAGTRRGRGIAPLPPTLHSGEFYNVWVGRAAPIECARHRARCLQARKPAGAR